MQAASIKKGQRVLLTDDLLATGGSLTGACQLITDAGGIVAECLIVIELLYLNGRNNVPAPIHSLVKYE